MTKIKICGIRREEDIRIVNKYKPHYVGFVFAESKRRVTPQHVKEISQTLDSGINRVGIFVNESLENVVNIADICSLQVIQLHGDESAKYLSVLKSELGRKNKTVDIWKAIRVMDKNSIKQMEEYNANAFVLDAYSLYGYGGVGRTFDWFLAQDAKNYGEIILAGGLNIENINEAINSVRPFAVDVSSGVESDGFKDETKVKEFINSVKNWR